MRRQIKTDQAASPSGAYSQAIRAGGFIFTSGAGPVDPKTGRLRGSNIEEQTRQVLDNLSAVLEAAGSSLADVVKATVHLSDASLFTKFNTVYADYFPDPKPARTTVASGLQALPGCLVEIDVVAYQPPKKE